MVLLDSPPFFGVAFVLATVVCVGFGTICSQPRIWDRFFPGHTKPIGTGTTYLKAGEYGESDGHPHGWSVFKEPLNAWSSLAYTFFGVVILYTGYYDSTSTITNTDNVLQDTPIFSIIYGLSCIYLGIASFLFHASHAETWRKADAGMTTGVMVAPLMLGIWDRARPPAATVAIIATMAVILQVSLTHGYVPYGSSDILLPTLVAICWILELCPRYQGAMDWDGESALWLQCFYGAVGGMLLRLSDIKRKQKGFFTQAIRGFFLVTLVFAYCLPQGLLDPLVLCGLVAGGLVVYYPSSGHIFWHLGSSYALYVWWLTFRIRPGDPALPYSNDRELIVLALLVAVKNGITRLMMNVTLPSWMTITSPTATNGQGNHEELKKRLMILCEHLFFTVWAYYVIFLYPNGNNNNEQKSNRTLSSESKGDRGFAGMTQDLFASTSRVLSDPSVRYPNDVSQSWLVNTQLCWSEPAFPSEAFHLFYAAKCATHIEDLLLMAVHAWVAYRQKDKKPLEQGKPGLVTMSLAHHTELGEPIVHNESQIDGDSQEQKLAQGQGQGPDRPPPRDVSMTLHHIATATLCLQSYALGYVKIGSVIMFLHDISDIPLDLVRLFGALQWSNKFPLICSYLTLLVGWMYWRLWFFPTTVLYSIAVESKSLLLTNEGCDVGHCTWAQVPERYPFLALLGVLQILHVLWFVAIVRKGYKELVG